jgi:hypothetical protein
MPHSLSFIFTTKLSFFSIFLIIFFEKRQKNTLYFHFLFIFAKKFMGLTIHYTFRLRDMAQLSQLEDEVEDICKSLGWKCRRFDDVLNVLGKAMPLESGDSEYKDVHLKGVYFTPTDCETAFLTFTPQGWTCSFMNIETADIVYELDIMLPYSIHVKTQYAGEDIHIALCSLLKYLEQKYFVATDTKVFDEGSFWETLDKNVLHERFDTYWALINSVKAALGDADWKVTDNPLEVATQLEELLKKKLGY